MNAIVAVNDDWGIGFKGRLLVRNKADMHRFVELTMGGTVLMGRTTFESFPGGALKGRRNVVLTHNPSFTAPSVEVVHSVDEALAAVGVKTGVESGTKPMATINASAPVKPACGIGASPSEQSATTAAISTEQSTNDSMPLPAESATSATPRSKQDQMESSGSLNDVWVIGGERVYRELLPYCSRVYATKNHTTMPADAFFPNLDADPAWAVASTEPGGITKAGVPFDFVTYARVEPLASIAW